MKVPTLPRRSTAPVICVDDSDDEKDCPIFEKIDPKTRQEIQKNSSVHDLTEVRREIDGDRKMSRTLSVTQDREIKDLLKTLEISICFVFFHARIEICGNLHENCFTCLSISKCNSSNA